MFVRLSPLAALALVAGGCSADHASPFPYAAGLTWTAQESVTSVTQSYRRVDGQEAYASVGVVGDASTCGRAEESAGDSTATATEVRAHAFEVLGNTFAEHPSTPGADHFSRVGVSVLAHQVATSGRREVIENFHAPDADDEDWTETSVETDARETSAAYEGVSADEYIVSFPVGGLWDDLDPNDGVVENQGFTLLSKHLPSSGDVWSSYNGGTVYRYDGTETISVGGKDVVADRVLVFANGNFDATGGDVLEGCILRGDVEETSNQDDAPSYATEVALLDPGCVDQFVSQEVGVQHWYNNALVQFTGTRVLVEIGDYGWEWYTKSGDFCSRSTNEARPVDEDDAALFAEWTVTVETTVYTTDSFEVVKADAAE